MFYCFFIQIVGFPRLTETGKIEQGMGEVEHGTEEHRTVKKRRRGNELKARITRNRKQRDENLNRKKDFEKQSSFHGND